MKFRVMGKIALLSLSLLSSLALAKTISDNLVLVVYEGNAEVNMVLASANEPAKVLASSVASPVHVSYSREPGEEDYYDGSVTGMGHTGSLQGRDSETILFANALDNLRKSAKFYWTDLEDADEIRLNAVYIGIAGFKDNQGKTLTVNGKSMTKGQYIRKNMKKVLKLRHFIAPRDRLVQMDADYRLIGKVAKQKAGEDAETRDLDFIQLTTYATGHKIRDGVLEDDQVTFNSEGGPYQYGIKMQQDFFSHLPESCTAADFDNPDLKHIAPALKAMNAMPTVDVYGQVEKGAYLYVPDLGYSVAEQERLNNTLPHRDFNHLFVREKSKKNEAGYLGFWVLQQEIVPEGVKEQDWNEGQQKLTECAKSTFIPAIKRVVDALGEEGVAKTKEGANVPLFMVGEFPVGQVLRLRQALTEILSEEDQKRIVWMKPLHYRQFLAQAGIKLLKKNGFKLKKKKEKPAVGDA
ncbi:hypothetical protein [Endozoicomonas arenosclerae]|uniref:hypothetical protein n=1 Tax=Endozoicomonas arenosclerae TaxID=1633495 RepID=UPI0007808F6D|nr:hypothetical protein [Endozoicomonas arenosclerae]